MKLQLYKKLLLTLLLSVSLCVIFFPTSVFAANGEFTGSTSNSNITPKIIWTSTADTDTNTSTVTASFYLYKSSSSSNQTYGTGSWVISIDGVQTTITQYVSLYNSQGYVFVGSATASVAHQDNGKKSITIQVTGGIPNTTYTSTSLSKTVTLDAISDSFGSVTLSDSSFAYNGEVQIPSVSVTNSAGSILTEGEDYTLTYSDAASTEAGSYTVTVTGLSIYSSSGKTLTYTIGSAQAVISELILEDKIYDGSPMEKPDYTYTADGIITECWQQLIEGVWTDLSDAPIDAGAYRFCVSISDGENFTGVSATSNEAQIIRFSSYSVQIPKVLILDVQTETAQYQIVVCASLSEGESVFVTPSEEFLLYSEDSALDSKDALVGSVTQEQTFFSKDELDASTDHTLSSMGTVTAEGISAGRWYGEFYFEIGITSE